MPQINTSNFLRIVSFLKDECIKCVMTDMCFGTDVNAFDKTLDHILEDKASLACLATEPNKMTVDQLKYNIEALKGQGNDVEKVLTGGLTHGTRTLREILVELFDTAATCIGMVRTCKAAFKNPACPP